MTMNDPYMLQSDAPMISGQWYNPKTGDSFVVRDSYLENNEYIILAMDGRRFNYDMIADYVQSDGPIQKIPDQSPIAQIDKKALLEGLDLDDPLNNDILNTTLNPPAYTTPYQNPTPEQEESFDKQLVNRVLRKAQGPQISCDVMWDKFPSKQLDMLVDLMDVSVEEICNYYIEQIDVNTIREQIKKELVKSIEEQMGWKEVTKEEVPVTHSPKKKKK